MIRQCIEQTRFRGGALFPLQAVLVTVSLAGCVTHPVNESPAPVVVAPQTYSQLSGVADAWSVPWWRNFDDPALNALVEAALEDNFTLAQAASRIDRAEAFLRQARAVRKPQVGLGISSERTWEHTFASGLNGPSLSDRVGNTADRVESAAAVAGWLVDPSQGGVDGVGDPFADARPEDRDDWSTDTRSSLSLSWEADLWGRLRSAEASEREEVAALTHDYEALRLTLSAQVAETYFETVEQRLQLELLSAQRTLAQTLLELVELRFLQGSASSVDVLQQRGQLAEIDSEVPQVQAQLGLLENRLDVLLGQPADGVDRVKDPVVILPDDTDLPLLGVPATLLARRPDLVARQRSVVASDHLIAEAMAARLPQITLDGSLAFAASGGASVLTTQGAGSLFQPLLDWGLREAEVEASKAVFQESLLGYTEAFLVAIEEVETALWLEARHRDLIDALVNQEAILAQTIDEARVRFGLGVTDYLPVLTALQNQQDVQRDLLQQRRELVALRIRLYRAVGGATREPASAELAETAPENGRISAE